MMFETKFRHAEKQRFSCKGISPIIASVLIVLVAVSLVSAYTVWISRVTSDVQEQSGEQIQRETRELFSDLNVEGVNRQTITIRNSGSTRLSAAAVDIFYDGEPIEYAADFDTLEPDDLGELMLRELWKYGHGEHDVKISAGQFFDTVNVNVEPPSGRVVDLRFEEGSGTSAADSSGNGNDAVLNGTLWARDTPHASSSFALKLDGVNDYINVTHRPSMNVTADMTLEIWFNRAGASGGTSDATYHGLIRSVAGSVWTPRLLVESDGSPILFQYNSGGDTYNLYSQNLEMPVNEWHHIIVKKSSAGSEIYYDGRLVGSNSMMTHAVTSGTSSRMIGAGADLFVHYMANGVVDDVKIYNRAYEPDELYVMKSS